MCSSPLREVQGGDASAALERELADGFDAGRDAHLGDVGSVCIRFGLDLDVPSGTTSTTTAAPPCRRQMAR